MAPSVAELPKDAAPVPIHVKAISEATETAPKIRRIIDEEGGKITASV
jgi:hypothetical protein